MDSRINVPVAWRTRLQVNRSYRDYWRRSMIDARNRRRAKKLRSRSVVDHEINLVEISDSEDEGGYNMHCDFRNKWKNSPVRSKLGNTSREINDAASVHHCRVSSPWWSRSTQVNIIECISSDSELENCPSNDGGGGGDQVNESESARKSSPYVSDQKGKWSYDEKDHQQDRLLLLKEDEMDDDRISPVLPITLSDDDDEQASGEDVEPKKDDWKWKGRPLKKRFKVVDFGNSQFDDEQQQEEEADKQECPVLPMNSSLEDMDAIAKDKILEEMNFSPETRKIVLTHLLA